MEKLSFSTSTKQPTDSANRPYKGHKQPQTGTSKSAIGQLMDEVSRCCRTRRHWLDSTNILIKIGCIEVRGMFRYINCQIDACTASRLEFSESMPSLTPDTDLSTTLLRSYPRQ